MAIEHRPESDFPYWVVRNDGSIVCACASEDAAERFDRDEELRAKAARITALQEEAQGLGFTLEPSRWPTRYLTNLACSTMRRAESLIDEADRQSSSVGRAAR